MKIEEIEAMAEIVVGRGFTVSLFLSLFCLNLFFATGVQAIQIGNEWTGPWVDKILYDVIANQTNCIHALINGDVDIIGHFINPAFRDQLSNAEDVRIFESLGLGYGMIEINCRKYPMNFTNFRRAIAFALDKHKIVEEFWLGQASLLDCCIPQQHPASIEDEMTYHYYDKNIEEGIRLLELEGFIDSDEDGWREGPGPEGPGTIELDTIIVEGYDSPIIDAFTDTVVQALHDLNMNAESRHFAHHEYNPRLSIHGDIWSTGRPGYSDYDIYFHSNDFSNLDLDFIALNYGTENIHTPLYNPSNWSNATWDSYAEIVLHSTDYDEILQAMKQMEHIWVHSCPSIILYQNRYFTAARTDIFEGITPTIIDGAPSYFTNLRVHRKNADAYGGTYTWAIPMDIASFNPYSENSYSANTILSMMFDSLVRIDPDGNDILWMCDSYSVETHRDNPNISEGHTRITIDVVRNATWSNGIPITAEDFAFSLNFIYDHVPPIGRDLRDIVACYSLTPDKLICEFTTESFWHWHNVAYKSVIPRQVWLEYANAYDNYQPNPENLVDMIVSGPFIPATWVKNNFVEMRANDDYFKNPKKIPESQTTVSGDNITTTTDELVSPQTQGFIAGVACAVTIILVLDYFRRKRASGGEYQ